MPSCSPSSPPVASGEGVCARPTFAAWRVRLDPLLAAQETNTVYQAFRLRRRDHVASLRRRLSLWVRSHGATPGPVAFFVVAILIFLALVPFLGCCALILLALVSGLAAPLLFRHRVTGGFLPPRVSTVFSTKGFYEAAALDLWMTGATGRDIAEAIYLETLEEQGYWGAVVVVGLGAAIAGVFAWLGRPATIPGALILLGIGFVFRELLLAYYRSGMGGVGHKALLTRLRLWDAKSPLAETFGRGVLWFIAIVVVYIGAGASVFMFIYLFQGLNSLAMGLSHSETGWVVYLAKNRFSLAAIVLLFGLGFGLRKSQGWLQRRNARRIGKLLARAPLAYEVFMRGVVLGDPEGERWVRHLQELLSPTTPPSPLPPHPLPPEDPRDESPGAENSGERI